MMRREKFGLKPISSVGCDGRHSTVRARAGLEVQDIGAPIDVLWFRVPQSRKARARVRARRSRQSSSPSTAAITGSAPMSSPRAQESARRKVCRRSATHRSPRAGAAQPISATCKSWDDVKLLTVTIDRLRDWALPGLLCIGDAAHAMSPVGGVGINLAIQDAVATANALAEKLRRGPVTLET